MGKMIHLDTRETNADSALVLLEKLCCSANDEPSAAGISPVQLTGIQRPEWLTASTYQSLCEVNDIKHRFRNV